MQRAKDYEIVSFSSWLIIAASCFLLQATVESVSAESSGLTNKIPPQNHKVDGYRGIWYFNEKLDSEYAYKYSGGMATYCAKHRPFAVYSAAANKTFFCFGGAKKQNSRRLVHMVSYFDHQTGQVPQPTLLLDKQTDDAHDNPVISLDGEGYIWIFSTSHGRGRPSFVHKSVRPYDVDEFARVDATYEQADRQRPLDNFSYMQVWPIESRGFAAFFTRYNDPVQRTSMFMRSNDGMHWSKWQRLAAIEQGHYQISAVGGTKMASAFNYHPSGKGLNYRTNLYYLETVDGGQSWQTAAGQPLAVPVTAVDNASRVHDYASDKLNVYVKDLVFDDANRPIIVYLTSKGFQSGPENDPRRWHVACWTGSRWRISTVTTSDNNYDMGSLYLEPQQWRLIAPVIAGPQAYNPGGEVGQWISRDQGRTWQPDRSLTEASPMNHSYVRRPLDAHPDFYAFWSDGHGRRPSECRLYFCNQQGEVFQLPTSMTTRFAKPKRILRE